MAPALSATAIVLVTAATPAEAVVVTRASSGTTAVDAHAGTLAWSRFDEDRGRYRLIVRLRGRSRALPVPPRSVPFDVDLGPDGQGGTVAVYSRCRREGRPSDFSDPLPTYSAGSGCDVYRYDFARRRETRVRGAASRGRSEFLPTVWKGVVVFAAREEGSRTGDQPLAAIFAARRGRAARLPGGTPPTATDPMQAGPGPMHLDLRGDRLAVAWGVDAACPGASGGPGPGGVAEPQPLSELVLVDVARRTRTTLGRGCHTGDTSILGFLSPEWLGPEKLVFVGMERKVGTPTVAGVYDGGVLRYGSEDLRTWSVTAFPAGFVFVASGARGAGYEIRTQPLPAGARAAGL